jgi:3-oxoacyl-[acyl-carrier-protein] synthase II
MAEPNPAIAITGIGAATPLGNSFGTIADALAAGRSGVGRFDAGTFGRPQEHPAAVVADIPSPPASSVSLPPGEFSRRSRLEQLALGPAAWAVHDAGLKPGSPQAPRPNRIGVITGSGAEQLKDWERDYLDGGRDVFAATNRPTVAQRLAMTLGITGPTTTVAAACASSGFALGLARSWLAAGWVDACLVGGCDVLSPTALAAFHNLRALSRRDDEPARASRPFDRDRDGFVMGEGGVFFVLERRADADFRGARCYGELAGVGMSGDASHMVTPCSDPTQAARAIAAALADANVTAEAVDYINAHAAGTPVGDAAEAAAIRKALGPAADRVPVSSTKSMSGHLISAASAFEALACLAAIDGGFLPPTINLDEPDEACRLAHVPHTAVHARVEVAASNSFGFGGANLCLVLKRAA